MAISLLFSRKWRNFFAVFWLLGFVVCVLLFGNRKSLVSEVEGLVMKETFRNALALEFWAKGSDLFEVADFI